MKHFLSIEDLSERDIHHLLDRSFAFKNIRHYPRYAHYTLANLFYENSTRTRVSFELAARHLSLSVVNLDIATSSENKGETIEDTLKTLAAMGIHLFVIRHLQEGLPAQLAAYADNYHILNAGDGKHAHPSQAMLDLMTIVEKKPRLDQLKIAIVGDLRHSRVANSLQHLFRQVGVKALTLVAPTIWQPQTVHFGEVTDSLPEGLEGADVVIVLRVQQERLAASEHLDLPYYQQHYTISTQAMAYAKPDAIVMHPGPMNRGIEIANAVADSPQSVILTQVQNGIYMRMAIIESLIG